MEVGGRGDESWRTLCWEPRRKLRTVEKGKRAARKIDGEKERRRKGARRRVGNKMRREKLERRGERKEREKEKAIEPAEKKNRKKIARVVTRVTLKAIKHA